jgi:hypothetical protein
MLAIDYSKAAQLAADIRNANVSIDDALVGIATLTQSMLMVCRNSDIPAAKSQAAIEEVTAGMVKLVDARKDFVAAHKRMVVVQQRSNLNIIDFGCDGNGPIRTGGHGLHVVNG